ncbi:unnamed protein product [Symbiodinium necroappetens]|uniref:Uncharacterized protein n=1 Tax=Symbiodinium necroappetens TaxID=1628268 RepID=A0A812TXL8_9DINO|nr:unnamed protein product [Symbiodinium necroappetens]
MLRYFNQKKKRGPAASESLRAIWESEDGCEKVRKLLKDHGTFKDVEVSLKKKTIDSETNALAGEYVNEATLINIHGWDEDMIKFSKERARAAGMLRKSEEHGKDEWRAVLSESFLKKNEKIQEKEQQASEVMEARVHI